MTEELNEKSREEADSEADRSAKEGGALWTYATRVYAVPAVAKACLAAQDEFDADVNLLLYAAWRGTVGDTLRADDLAEAIDVGAAWRAQVVIPLRQTRRAWKGDPQRAEYYPSIKVLELEAERRQLQFLEDLVMRRAGASGTDGNSATQPEPAALIEANLGRVAAQVGIEAPLLESLSSALIDASEAYLSNP